MTSVRMCDNCNQIIKDKQPVYITLHINNLSFGLDCHIDCVPDWVRAFHEKQTDKYKSQQRQQTTQTTPSNIITF